MGANPMPLHRPDQADRLDRSNRFRGKVALVTGSGKGLGRGIALAFAREGAKLVVNCLHQEEVDRVAREIEEAGAEALPLVADISSSADVKAMFAATIERFGTLDILVNNAAVTPSDRRATAARLGFLELMTTPAPKRSLAVTREMEDEDWLRMISVNLNGVFYCTREALGIMEPKGCGKIVNIASIAGMSGISFHSPHYSASKGGVIAFTKSVGLEVIGAGVNVNCIAAGGIATEAWDHLLANCGEAVTARLLQMIPAGRMGSVDEYASLALYLASDEASYLVGQVISPNGGVVT
jgi:3-oxoacyl-[acyl-carrier protein] reductase